MTDIRAQIPVSDLRRTAPESIIKAQITVSNLSRISNSKYKKGQIPVSNLSRAPTVSIIKVLNLCSTH
jgi:hypothetical protein